MFRKWLCALLVGAMLFTIPAVSLAETQYATVTTPTSDGSVYIRSKAGAGQPVVGAAHNGDTLVILERGSTWHKVKVVRTGTSGWMYAPYIKFTTVSTDTETEINQTGTISSGAGYANFRTGAGTSYGLISQLKNGTKVQVLKKIGSWYYVKLNSTNQYGYISASLVSVNAPVPPVVPETKTTVISSSDGFANLRKGPGTMYGIVAPLKNGTKVDITSTFGTWSRVEVPSTNQYGFVYTNLLKTVSVDPAPTPAPVVTVNATGRITSGDGFANFRTGAGTSNTILAKLNNGVLVTILGSEGNWYKAQLTDAGMTGYVFKNLVETLPQLETRTATGNVNMRSGPGTQYAVKTVVAKGTPVSVLGYNGNFAYVNANSWIGYVSMNYLK